MTKHAQDQYQVRFDWGAEGAREVAADVDVLVWVDVLADVALGEPRMPLAASSTAIPVLAGSLQNRTAVAEWVLARQAEKGDRFAVAIVAAGEARPDGSVRFGVEDLLGAGAIIDALAEVGIDYCSPEAAAASAAFTGLRRAVAHLVSASVAGRQLLASGREAEVAAASMVDASTEVRVIGAGVSEPLEP